MQNGIGISEQEEISPIEVLWSKNLSKEGVVVTALRSMPAHRGNAHVRLPPQHYYQGPSRIQLNIKLNYAAPEPPEPLARAV